ncbi:MAG TPA: hypothetical protein VK689_04300, partial [Armatimonadota bacterium]|nr:hypothetical protein [Armatimonadota bacterium]
WIGAATGLRDSPLRHSPFFATTIRSDQKLAILMVAYGGAALGGALAAASPASRWATGLRRGALVVATGLSYCSLLGQLWGTLSPTYRLAGMALPLVLLAWAYFARTSDLGRGALLSSREIRWLSRRWDNPVFIRDLRAALRAASLTRQSSSVLLWAAVAVSASAWLTTVAPLSTVFTVYAGPAIASSPGFLFRASACLAFFSPMLLCFLFIMPGERAQKLWKKEHQLGTFSQLLASPLPTATLVQGRWMASALVGAAAPVTCVLLSVAGLFAFAATRPAELGLYVALELYLVSVGLVVAASAAAMVQPEKGAGRTNWLFQLLALLGFTAEVLLALPMALPLLNPFSDVGSPPALVVLGLTVAPLNVWLAYWLYRRTVVALERMRCSDVG